jgi:WhiB family redox-sensing transcriptional regulator
MQQMKDKYLLLEALTPYTQQEAEWRNKAACTNSNPDLFFPTRGTAHATIQEARQICNTCPAKQQCYEYAIQHADRSLEGIWAGLTALERRKERRRLGIQGKN